MDKYQVIKKLGEGAYGVVVKCVNTQTQELVAIKKMKGQYASWDACIKMPEVQALKKLNSSPYLIKIKEMVHNKKENEVNIVFEYCDKNLFQEMQEKARKNQAFSEMEIKIIMF
jgi:male germ cell-associated kinase|tara:strand:+ start:103 stop:444 length:342 start_codon:yes stop_codon:yes gene_type:complete